ncbi:roadblock/LC7 domain-containing protein [Streptomyces sp. CAU 1734]|uniref:roadblock/LC7 domain-containing protein n=1 Tax=Streptomyces sp. CAU 1734 TaxID=3140360 RepID=UPI003260964A
MADKDDRPGGGAGAATADDPAGDSRKGLDWLLDDLVARTGRVRQAVLLTADGLVGSASRGMVRRDIDHLAAVCAGLHGLAKDAGDRLAVGSVRQTMIMLDQAFLFVTPAADGSRLAVLADAETDVGQLAHEMALLVSRVGGHMAVTGRGGRARPAGG